MLMAWIAVPVAMVYSVNGPGLWYQWPWFTVLMGLDCCTSGMADIVNGPGLLYQCVWFTVLMGAGLLYQWV